MPKETVKTARVGKRMRISEKLVDFRKTNNLTIARTAMLIGVDAVTVWRWETGKVPGPRYKTDIDRVLSMSPYDVNKTISRISRAREMAPRNPHRKYNIIFLDTLCAFLASEQYVKDAPEAWIQGYNAALDNIKRFATGEIKENILGEEER